MKLDQLRSRCRPHLWYQLYWVVYLIWFFWLDLTITAPKYILHSPLDDLIPFNEWFVLPYCSWFLLLAGVTAALWWCDTASYDKLCLTMFSGMTFCLIVYMILPNGLELRPAVETLGRDNPALRVMQLQQPKIALIFLLFCSMKCPHRAVHHRQPHKSHRQATGHINDRVLLGEHGG